MRIAFTGAHCTGKTTMLKDICQMAVKESLEIGYISEVARRIINKGYPLNMDANIDSYVHYINDQLLAESEKMDKYDIFISDRTLLDPVAYARVNSRLPRPYIPQYFIDMMQSVWLLESKRYDLYVYFPIEFELEMDGIRPSDEEYRHDIDKEILSILNENNINYVKVIGTPKERREYLFSIINQCE